MNGYSKFRSQNVMCPALRVHFHFQSERYNPCAYPLPSDQIPSLCTHTLQKASDLVRGIFFLYPRDLNIIKYNKLRGLTFLMSTKKHQFYDLPPPSIRKNQQQIYCLKTITSTNTLLLLSPPTSIPCGRHKCKVAYHIFYSSCDLPEKTLAVTAFVH